MTTQPRLNPRTQAIRADSVRTGHVVMESHEHPAVVARIAQRGSTVTFWCRYVWQAASEPLWPMGPLAAHTAVEISQER